jgi:periplasmic protein TonB
MSNATRIGLFGLLVFALGCSVGILVVTRHASTSPHATAATKQLPSSGASSARAATEGEIVAAVEHIAPAPKTRTATAPSTPTRSAPVTRPAAAPPVAKPEVVWPLPLAQPVAPARIELPRDEADTPSAPAPAPVRATVQTREVPPAPPALSVSQAPSTRLPGPLEPPQRIRRVPAQYPKVAQMANVEGTVVISAMIDVDGRVTSPRVVQSIPLLDKAALDAVRQWEFKPAMRDGRAVPVSVTLSVEFALR